MHLPGLARVAAVTPAAYAVTLPHAAAPDLRAVLGVVEEGGGAGEGAGKGKSGGDGRASGAAAAGSCPVPPASPYAPEPPPLDHAAALEAFDWLGAACTAAGQGGAAGWAAGMGAAGALGGEPAVPNGCPN